MHNSLVITLVNQAFFFFIFIFTFWRKYFFSFFFSSSSSSLFFSVSKLSYKNKTSTFKTKPNFYHILKKFEHIYPFKFVTWNRQNNSPEFRQKIYCLNQLLLHFPFNTTCSWINNYWLNFSFSVAFSLRTITLITMN